MRRSVGLAALAALALAGSAHAGTIYQNDFNANASGFTGGALVVAPSGEQYLGDLTLGAATVLTLDTTGVVSSLTLEFDLYGILSPDGSSSGGPDSFKVAVTGGPVLLDETFSNFTFQQQTYGPGAPTDPGRTGSDASLYGHLGYYWRPDFYMFVEGGDTTYHLSYTFAPTGNSTTISFFGNTTNAADDESFGIDNVVVSGAVPEPATWAIMLLGFGTVGAALRRRKDVPATA